MTGTGIFVTSYRGGGLRWQHRAGLGKIIALLAILAR